jgi:hypothetical protein
MFCKNRITLIGFLGKDAETRFTPNGTAHTRFSLATKLTIETVNLDDDREMDEFDRQVIDAGMERVRAEIKRVAAEGSARRAGQNRSQGTSPRHARGCRTRLRWLNGHPTDVRHRRPARRREVFGVLPQ